MLSSLEYIENVDLYDPNSDYMKEIDFLISRWKEMDCEEGNNQKPYSTTGRKCKIMFSDIDQSIKQDEIEKKSLASKGGSRDKLANVIPIQCVAKYASLTEWKPSDNPTIVDAYYKCVKDIVLREVSLIKMLAVAARMDELYWQYCYGRMLSSSSGRSLNTGPFIKIRKRIRMIQNEVAIAIAHFRGVSISLIDHIIKWRKEVKKEKLKKEPITIFWSGQNYLHKMMEDVNQLYNIPTIRLWLGFIPNTFLSPPQDNHNPKCIWQNYHHEYEIWYKKRNNYIWTQSIKLKTDKKKNYKLNKLINAAENDGVLEQMIEADRNFLAASDDISLADAADILTYDIELRENEPKGNDDTNSNTNNKDDNIDEMLYDNINNLQDTSSSLFLEIELKGNHDDDNNKNDYVKQSVSVDRDAINQTLSQNDHQISLLIQTESLNHPNDNTNTNTSTSTVPGTNTDDANVPSGEELAQLLLYSIQAEDMIGKPMITDINATNTSINTNANANTNTNTYTNESIANQTQISAEEYLSNISENMNVLTSDSIDSIQNDVTNTNDITSSNKNGNTNDLESALVEEGESVEYKAEGSLAASSLVSSIILATSEEWHTMRTNCFYKAWKQGGPYPNETIQQNIEGCEEFWNDMMHNPNVVEAAVGFQETFPKVQLCPPLPESLLKKISEAELVLQKELKTFEKLAKTKTEAATLKDKTFRNMHIDTLVNGSMGERFEKSIREYEMLKNRQQSNRGLFNNVLLSDTLYMNALPEENNNSNEIFDLTEFKFESSQQVSQLKVFQKGVLKLDMSKIRKTLQDRLADSIRLAEKVDDQIKLREKVTNRPVDITSNKWKNKCATEITKTVRSFLAKKRVQNKWKMLRIEWATRVIQRLVRGGLGRINARERKRKFRIEQMILRKTILKKNVSSQVVTKMIKVAGEAIKTVKEEEKEKRKAMQLSAKFAKKVNEFVDHRFGGQLAGDEGDRGIPVMIKSQSAPIFEHDSDHRSTPQATPKSSRPSSREQITKVLDEHKRKSSTIVDEKVLNKLHSDGMNNVILPPAPASDVDDTNSSESQSRIVRQKKFAKKRDNCRESRLIPKRPLDINESHITYRPFAKVSQSHPERSFLVPMIPPKALIERPDECYVPFDLYEKKGEEVKHLPKSKIDLMKMTSLLKHTL